MAGDEESKKGVKKNRRSVKEMINSYEVLSPRRPGESKAERKARKTAEREAKEVEAAHRSKGQERDTQKASNSEESPRKARMGRARSFVRSASKLLSPRQPRDDASEAPIEKSEDGELSSPKRASTHKDDHSDSEASTPVKQRESRSEGERSYGASIALEYDSSSSEDLDKCSWGSPRDPLVGGSAEVTGGKRKKTAKGRRREKREDRDKKEKNNKKHLKKEKRDKKEKRERKRGLQGRKEGKREEKEREENEEKEEEKEEKEEEKEETLSREEKSLERTNSISADGDAGCVDEHQATVGLLCTGFDKDFHLREAPAEEEEDREGDGSARKGEHSREPSDDLSSSELDEEGVYQLLIQAACSAIEDGEEEGCCVESEAVRETEVAVMEAAARLLARQAAGLSSEQSSGEGISPSPSFKCPASKLIALETVPAGSEASSDADTIPHHVRDGPREASEFSVNEEDEDEYVPPRRSSLPSDGSHRTDHELSEELKLPLADALTGHEVEDLESPTTSPTEKKKKGIFAGKLKSPKRSNSAAKSPDRPLKSPKRVASEQDSSGGVSLRNNSTSRARALRDALTRRLSSDSLLRKSSAAKAAPVRKSSITSLLSSAPRKKKSKEEEEKWIAGGATSVDEDSETRSPREEQKRKKAARMESRKKKKRGKSKAADIGVLKRTGETSEDGSDVSSSVASSHDDENGNGRNGLTPSPRDDIVKRASPRGQIFRAAVDTANDANILVPVDSGEKPTHCSSDSEGEGGEQKRVTCDPKEGSCGSLPSSRDNSSPRMAGGVMAAAAEGRDAREEDISTEVGSSTALPGANSTVEQAPKELSATKDGEKRRPSIGGLLAKFPGKSHSTENSAPVQAKGIHMLKSQVSSLTEELLADGGANDQFSLAVKELVKTEEAYLKDLSLVKQHIIEPFKAKKILDKRGLAEIFVNWETLPPIHMKILRSLITENSLRGIAGAFSEEVLDELRKLYTTYCCNYENALNTAKELTTKNPAFAKHLYAMQNECAVLNGLSLYDYLIKPFQRVCKYPLLLSRIFKLSAETDPAREELQQCVTNVEQYLDGLNQMKDQAENWNTLLDWSNRLNLRLMVHQRRFLFASTVLLSKACSQTMDLAGSAGSSRKARRVASTTLLLCNDVLISVDPKAQKKGAETASVTVPVDQLLLIEPPEHSLCFRIADTFPCGLVWDVTCNSIQEQHSWVTEIKGAIRARGKQPIQRSPVYASDCCEWEEMYVKHGRLYVTQKEIILSWQIFGCMESERIPMGAVKKQRDENSTLFVETSTKTYQFEHLRCAREVSLAIAARLLLLDEVADEEHVTAASNAYLLNKYEREKVVRLARQVSYAPGDALIAKGDTLATLRQVQSGRVTVESVDVELSVGALLGEMGFVSGLPATATVRALTKVTTAELDQATMDGLLEEDPVLAAKLWRMMASTAITRLVVMFNK